MPSRKKATAALPEHLEEFLAGLEAQVMAGKDPNRDEALRPIEQRLGRLIDIEVELQDHPAAQERFDLIWRRMRMRVADKAVGAAAAGKASASNILRAMGGIPRTPERGGTARLQLEREHRANVERHRTGW